MSQLIKQAGLIGVPESLNKEVSDYIISCYSYHLLQEFNSMLSDIKTRNNIPEIFFASLQTWDLFKDDLLFKAAISPSQKYLDQIVDFCDSNKLTPLNSINTKIKDPDSDLNGVIHFSTIGLSFSLSKDSDTNLYSFSLIINLPDNNLKTNALVSNKTYLEMFNLLPKIENKISEAVNSIWNSMDSFALPRKEDTDKLSLIRSFLTKSAISLESRDRIFKQFTFDRGIIPEWVPSIRNLRLLTLSAHLITNLIESRNIHKNKGEDWGGLWSPQNPNVSPVSTPKEKPENDWDRDRRLEKEKAIRDEEKRTGIKAPKEPEPPVTEALPPTVSGFIGNLYVNSDPMIDADNMKKSKDPFVFLNHKIELLRDTVRHELQHLFQTYVSQARPEQPLSEEEKKNGVIKLFNPRAVPRKMMDTSNPDEHSLKDEELYPVISDQINVFNRLKSNLPKQFHKFYTLAWVGEMTKETFERLLLEKLKKFDPDHPIDYYAPVDALNVQNIPFLKLREDFLKNPTTAPKRPTFYSPAKNKLTQPVAVKHKYQKAVSEFIKNTDV